MKTDIRTGRKTVLLGKDKLHRPGSEQAMPVADFAFTADSANCPDFYKYGPRLAV